MNKIKFGRQWYAAILVFLSAGILYASSPVIPLEGKVGEVLNADRYTYLRVDTEDGSHWVATTPTGIKTGAEVKVPDGIVMENFSSPVLDKTFEYIVFAEYVEWDGVKVAATSKGLPPGHPPVEGHASTDNHKAECPVSAENTEPVAGFRGEIVETMDAGGYTYVQVRSADKTVWAAAGPFKAVVGQQVIVPEGMVMKNFKSPSLGKTFDEIYFVDRIVPVSGMQIGAQGSAESGKEGHAEDSSGEEAISLPEGGILISDIYQRREELAGQVVIVRGRVVKYSEQIMEKNWVHLQDGSSTDSDGDLTVTTQESFALGDVVTMKGTIVVDSLIGEHYQYPVMLEGAVSITE